MGDMVGVVVSVNRAESARTDAWTQVKSGRSGIDKRPAAGPVLLGAGGVAGDTICDTRHHGGPDRAVYAYAAEDLAYDRHLVSLQGSSMRARLSLALIALGACSSDTAIVLSIHATDDTAKGSTQLEVYLGAGAVTPASNDEEFPSQWWLRANVAIDPTTLRMEGGLGDVTFDLSLTPSSDLSLDDEIVYVVAGRDAQGRMIVPAVALHALVPGVRATSDRGREVLIGYLVANFDELVYV